MPKDQLNSEDLESSKNLGPIEHVRESEHTGAATPTRKIQQEGKAPGGKRSPPESLTQDPGLVAFRSEKVELTKIRKVRPGWGMTFSLLQLPLCGPIQGAVSLGSYWSWPRAVDSYGLEIQAAGAYLLS